MFKLCSEEVFQSLFDIKPEKNNCFKYKFHKYKALCSILEDILELFQNILNR